jgi:hypothetical protein
MKKKTKIFSVIAVLVIIGAIFSKFFLPSFFYGYIYPFNRIKGNVSITIDGKDIPLSECEVTCILRDKKEKVHVSGSKIKSRAGKYGAYIYKIKHDDIEIRYYLYQSNCWNCADYDVKFSVDTSEKTVTCKGTRTSLCEDGSKTTADFDRVLTLDYRESDRGFCLLSA